MFGVERPHSESPVDYRSTRTTLFTHRGEAYARPVYEIEPAEVQGKPISPFPGQCPRCSGYRAPGVDGREVIEPLRTRGPQSFSVVVGEGFRNQARARSGEPPNYGRKALLFSDSRQEAAILAANLRRNHGTDLFRQLAYRVLHSCPSCAGNGQIEEQEPFVIGQPRQMIRRACTDCAGTGRAAHPVPLDFATLRGRMIHLEMERGINPTFGETPDFYTRLDDGDQRPYADAELAFNVALRRELAEDEFALEPLGLATWRVGLPEQAMGCFPCLDVDETRALLRAVARILATENGLLPPPPYKPWEWDKKQVKPHERLVVIPATGKGGRDIVPYNLTPRRKLGRYIMAIAQALVADGRLADAAAAKGWLNALHWPLWETLKGVGILHWAGAKINEQVPHGIPISAFTLHPLAETVHQCRSCAYIMSEALFDVCVRCGQQTRVVETSSLRNYYRRAALHAVPGSSFDDPYPLRASEHTAQIGSDEARNEERWFQDLFHDHQNHHDHRVDILSVTTTMEMGIDIGSLLCVGLRNVPPTVANYQQRAGRAGRRGSALATVFTYAQARSHDQYYFARPPEIVSDPPRVPALYLHNDVIVRRHVRSLVLQGFFYALFRSRAGQGMFETWGSVADFSANQTAAKLKRYLTTHRAALLDRCARVVPLSVSHSLGGWLDALSAEVAGIADAGNARDHLFEALINSGLLPKYAFPTDVVSLSVPTAYQQPIAARGRGQEGPDSNLMQRDLRIALAEYAPGAEVVKGSFPNTFKYRSIGVHDPFAREPAYGPTGILVECDECQSATVLGVDDTLPERCSECDSFTITPLPYLRPAGFTVDAALPQGGAEPYEGDGRERSGYVAPARLVVGQTALTMGTARGPFAARLHTHVRVGELFACNKGQNRDFPGYLLCPVCGRALDPDDRGSHTHPADVPPHQGKQRGPRAGQPCPNTTEFQNQVILGYVFHSEVILLGVDLPDSLDAPYGEASGKAIWYSFGVLISNAATLVLQIDPGELKIGTRAVRRGPGRLHGEVFLYDDVPGGAGYARAIDQNLEEILNKALDLGRTCTNSSCSGACYQCMYDYRNQALHPLLDRALGTAVLEYLLHGTLPGVEPWQAAACGVTLQEYARADWKIRPGMSAGPANFPYVLEDAAGERVGLWVIHPLSARPSQEERLAILAEHGVRCAVHTSFDLERRPFWVLNHLMGS